MKVLGGGKIATVIGVAFVWLAFFKLNALLFSSFEHSSRAHWIFLPAALRVLSVLLFDGKGALGLAIGAYLTLPHDPSSSLTYELMLSASSAIAPLVAIGLCRQLFPIAANLQGLRGKHVIALSIANAAANAAIMNLCMAVAGKLQGVLEQVVTIFVGDLLGAAILLALLSTGMRVMTPLPAKGTLPNDQVKGADHGS